MAREAALRGVPALRMEVAAAKDTGRALVRDFLLGLEPVLNSYVEHNITMAPGRAMDEDVCAESFRFQNDV